MALAERAAQRPTPGRARRALLHEALSRLASAQKPKAQTPAYLRYVNRRLGGYVAAGAYAVGRTPDQLTTASAALTGAGVLIVALLPPTWWSGVLASVLMLVGYAVDSADGQLARLRGGGSPAGEWLDHVVDIGKSCGIHIAVLVSVHRFSPEVPGAVLLLPLAFLSVSVTAFFGLMLRDQLLRTRPPVGGSAPAPAGSVLRSVLLLPADHGVLCLVFLLLGAPTLFLAAYGVLGLLHLVFAIRALLRSYTALGSPALLPT